MGNGQWPADRQSIVVLVEGLAGNDRISRVIGPRIGVHDLVAEVFERPPVKLIRAALGVDGDDPT